MSTEQRLLTKSLFKLAVECPRKMHYALNPHVYFDSSSQDSFLAKLAEGGYQVGELAKLMFPDGVDLSQLDQQEQLRRTSELLRRDSVVIFEAAIQSDGLFARVDILRKEQRSVEIIEVKAKAFDPQNDAVFRGKRGGFRAEVLPYLQDVAFQRHVFDLAYPDLNSTCSLLFADKSARATVTGINQMFPVGVTGGRLKVTTQAGLAAQALGTPLLTRVPLEGLVDDVLDAEVDLGPTGVMPLRKAVDAIAEARRQSIALPPKISACCRKCQFKVDGDVGPQRSGFHECWREQTGLSNEQLQQPLVLDLWNSRRVSRFVREGQYLMSQLTADDLGYDGSVPGEDGITLAQLHWFQATKKWPGGGEFYLHPELKRVMAAWRFPLHFIDFETATVAIPFHAGSRPYETVAFQFSHHVLEADGTARHQDQFLHVEPGVNPNVHFLRALKLALSKDDGTVFRWHNHENTVLNQIIDMLEEQRDAIHDAGELIAFALTLVDRESDGGERLMGQRAMVDLCALSQKYFFHPSTNGSPSLKKVLPALMKCSPELKRIYGRPAYGKGREISSLNFDEPIAWWQETDGNVCDPYHLLPPIAAQAEPGSVLQSLRDGGAAMTAYVRLQFETVPYAEREAVKRGLLRYCELDTLAMLMAVQAWRAWCF
jgi:hypothetical protein